jgi:hypothetical protein
MLVMRFSCGHWIAVSSKIHWLFAEGESFDDVVQTIERIAPELVAQYGITLPFSLEWQEIDESELEKVGLN